jgi:hypothetical protein
VVSFTLCEIYPYKFISYRAVNTPRQGFKNQSVNAVWRDNRGLFQDPCKTRKAELYYRVRSYRTENSSHYLRLLTSSGILWNSSVLTVILPSGGGPWNSKRHICLHLTEFYIRFKHNSCQKQRTFCHQPTKHFIQEILGYIFRLKLINLHQAKLQEYKKGIFHNHIQFRDLNLHKLNIHI